MRTRKKCKSDGNKMHFNSNPYFLFVCSQSCVVSKSFDIQSLAPEWQHRHFK